MELPIRARLWPPISMVREWSIDSRQLLTWRRRKDLVSTPMANRRISELPRLPVLPGAVSVVYSGVKLHVLGHVRPSIMRGNRVRELEAAGVSAPTVTSDRRHLLLSNNPTTDSFTGRIHCMSKGCQTVGLDFTSVLGLSVTRPWSWDMSRSMIGRGDAELLACPLPDDLGASLLTVPRLPAKKFTGHAIY